MRGFVAALALLLLFWWAAKSGYLVKGLEWLADKLKGLALAVFVWFMDKTGLD